MKFVLLLALVAVSQAAVGNLPSEAHAVVQHVTSRLARFSQLAQFQTLDDAPNFGEICGNELAGQLDGIVPGAGAAAADLFSCLNGICNLVSGSGSCPTLQTALGSQGGCAAPPASYIALNCQNGCFAKIPSAFNGVGQCIAGKLPGFINAIATLFCQQSAPTMVDACVGAAVTQFNMVFTPEMFVDPINQIPEQLSGPLNRLCLQNPATGSFCYGAFAAGAAALVNSDPTNQLNCAYWASLGCCLSGLKVMIGDFNGTSCGNNGTSPVDNEQLNFILANCGVNGQAVSASNPALGNIPSCPVKGVAVKIAKNSFTLTGLLIAGINGLTAAKKYLFWQALQLDLASNVGLTLTQTIYLSIGSVSAGTGANVIVTFVIRGATDTDTDTYAALVKAFIASTTAPAFPATTTFATANFSTSTTETQTGGSGVANLTASMLVLFFAMVVAIAMRF